MAKNSNKKGIRIKARKVAEQKQALLLRENLVDPYEATMFKAKKVRKEYYRHLCEAIEDPKYYEAPPYGACLPSDATHLASVIIKDKVSYVDRKSFKSLLEVGKRAKIIEEDGDGNTEYLEAFIRMAQYQWLWIRKPEDWKPSTKNRRKQFSLLLRHCLAKYDVPAFLDYAWLKDGPNEKNYREWFINLGSGENIRKQIGLPIKFTKKIAHNFLRAPSDLSVNGAIRWAQIMSMGGDRRIAMGVLATPLERSFVHDDFWVSVIRIFIDNPFLDTNQYGPIYDYLNNKKYVGRGRRWIDGVLVNLGPEQPGLSMKGRNPQALIDQVQRWHRDLSRTPFGQKDYAWESCGISGFEYKTKKALYKVVELLSSRDLRDEGAAMHHCVASYARSCNNGSSAIYSMTRTDEENGTKRLLTVEMNVASKTMMQARKKFNEGPTGEDLKIIGLWLAKDNLQKSRWVG